MTAGSYAPIVVAPALVGVQDPPLRIDGVPTVIVCRVESNGTLRVKDFGASGCSGRLSLADGSMIELRIIDSVPSYELVGSGGEPVARITVRPGGYLDVSVAYGNSSGEASSIAGLLGSPDGDPRNDLRTRDGRVMPQPLSFEQLHRDFGESWRITREESLLDYGPDESTETFTIRNFPATPCPPLTDEKRRAADKTCRAAGVTNEALIEACIVDIVRTGDPRFADSFVDVAEPRAALSVLPDSVDVNGPLDNYDADELNNGCAFATPAPKTEGAGTFLALGFIVISMRRFRRQSR